MAPSSLESPEFLPAQRNHGIDALRGLSILLVILLHIAIRIPLSKTALGAVLPAWLISAFVSNGYEAVFVFFVISGFLITNLSLRRWGRLERIDLKGFYGRRFARIAPLLVTLVLVLSVLDVTGMPGFVIHRPGQSLGGAIWAALGLHLNWYEGHTGYLPAGWDVMWSLSIEEVFYLAFPLLCLVTRRLRVLVPVLLLLVFSLPFARDMLAGHPIWQQKAYLPGMSAIAAGILGALIAACFKPRSRRVAMGLCVLGALGMAAVLFAEDALWPFLGNGVMLLLVLSAMCLVVGLHWGPRSGSSAPLPGLGWLRSFGRRSYEIYLTHAFVVLGGVAIFRYLGSATRWGWLWYLPIVLLCWLLGAAVARYFSVPADRALRAVLLRHEKPVPVPGGAALPAEPPLQ